LWRLSSGEGGGASFLGSFGGSLRQIRHYFRIFLRLLGGPSRFCNRMGFGRCRRNGLPCLCYSVFTLLPSMAKPNNVTLAKL